MRSVLVVMWCLSVVAQTRVVAPNQVVGIVQSAPGEVISGAVRPCPGPVITRTSATTLAIGSNWSPATPCIVVTNLGATTQVTAGATITLLPTFPVDRAGIRRAGEAYVYLTTPTKDTPARIGVAMRSSEHATCTGCTFNTTLGNFPQFPGGTVAVGVWAVNDGNIGQPAVWELDGFPILDEYELRLSQDLNLIIEQLSGVWTMRLDYRKQPIIRVVSPPYKFDSPCTIGDEARSSDGLYYYKCAYVPELTAIDQRHTRWTRTKVEVQW